MVALNGARWQLHILLLFHQRTEVDKCNNQREMQNQAAKCVGTKM